MNVIQRLDETVEEFSQRTRIFNEPLTPERARMFVCQHRLNSRERNSAIKFMVAANCPHYDLRIKILAGCAQEVIADHEFGHGRPHWAILEDLGVAIGMDRDEIVNAEPLPTTRLAWLAWGELIRNRHWLEGMIANTCAERVNVPGYGNGEFREQGWFGMERGRWKSLFGLNDDQIDFFEMHGPADLEHSNLGWQTVGRYAEELHMEDAVVEACRVNLYVWRTYLDGIVAAADALAKNGRAAAATA